MIKLDVGGHKYTTSLGTLLAVPDSWFNVLFAGRWDTATTEDGYVFIDRDGEVRK